MIVGRTSLPVSKVFAYCSEASNPVGAEWLIVEHMSGTEMGDAWDDLQLPQKRRLALDLIDLYGQLFPLNLSRNSWS
jgi:aminoglycoside phosphotransferase (APT) family kinase protein